MIQKLEWDSGFFGFNIANLELNETVDNLSFADDFARSNKIECIQTCCRISDVKIINLLEENAFNFADLKMTYSMDLSKSGIGESGFYTANEDDIPVLKDIARSIAVYSRYYNDRFGKEKAARLYEIWVEKSVFGNFDDACLKVIEGNSAVGFLTIRFTGNKMARIGLAGIEKSYRRKGIGKQLMNSLFNFLDAKGVETLEVSTQGKNIDAQNFYISRGFMLKSIDSWYYKFSRP